MKFRTKIISVNYVSNSFIVAKRLKINLLWRIVSGIVAIIVIIILLKFLFNML